MPPFFVRGKFMAKIKVAIVGASGYTGIELIRLLANHPDVEISVITSRQYEGEAFSAVFPAMHSVCDLTFSANDASLIADGAEIAFTALPHGTSMEIVPDLLKRGMKVVDLSADYRLSGLAVYNEWYGDHSSSELLSEAVYGLPELYREQITSARLVANPGCYPTSVVLALTPLLEEGLIQPQTIIADCKSGTSGAGRSAKVGSLFCEVNEGFRAYGFPRHRHTPEIEQTLSSVAGNEIVLSFTPHLLPVDRGILSTCYAQISNRASQADLQSLFVDRYADEPFVRVQPISAQPNIAYVRGSNYCDIAVVYDERTGRVVVTSVIDNLVKGAAGQAVQNMNIVCGFAEGAGLAVHPLFP